MPGTDEQRTSLAIPIFSSTETDLTTADAELWWPRFTLYIDLKQNINVSKYIAGTGNLDNDKETKLKKLLIWSIGQKAIHAMTRKLHNEPTESMTIKGIIELFQDRFMSDKNTQQNRKEFFELQQESDKTPQQTWEKLPDVERKCKFQTKTAEELIISKFRSVMKENELKDKLEKADQNIATFIKVLREDKYQRKHDNRENTEQNIKSEPINRIQQRNRTDTNKRYRTTEQYRKPDCKYCGQKN